MSSPVHVHNKKKDILILSEDPTRELDDTTLTTKKVIQLILQSIINSYVYDCIITEQIVIYLLMEKKFINLKQKIPKL